MRSERKAEVRSENTLSAKVGSLDFLLMGYSGRIFNYVSKKVGGAPVVL